MLGLTRGRGLMTPDTDEFPSTARGRGLSVGGSPLFLRYHLVRVHSTHNPTHGLTASLEPGDGRRACNRFPRYFPAGLRVGGGKLRLHREFLPPATRMLVGLTRSPAHPGSGADDADDPRTGRTNTLY